MDRYSQERTHHQVKCHGNTYTSRKRARDLRGKGLDAFFSSSVAEMWWLEHRRAGGLALLVRATLTAFALPSRWQEKTALQKKEEIARQYHGAVAPHCLVGYVVRKAYLLLGHRRGHGGGRLGPLLRVCDHLDKAERVQKQQASGLSASRTAVAAAAFRFSEIWPQASVNIKAGVLQRI